MYVVREKMLKESETEETISFCNIFITGGISIGGGGGGPPVLPLCYACV